MSARVTNLTILALLLIELGSGLGSLLVGSPGGSWVFWLHGAGGLSLVVLVTWKWRIVARSFARRRAGAWAVAPVLLGTIFVATLATGLWWAAVGRGSLPLPIYGSMRPLVLHTVLALVLIPPFIVHVAVRWPRARVADFASRRAALRLLGVGAGGLVLSRGLVASSVLIGPDRRFTGSREEASFTGNAHPVTNWLADRRQRIEVAGWRLSVRGEVARPAEIDHAELSAMPMREQREILDCTGGWYTWQDWAGVPLEAVIARARAAPEARSVVVRSVTGYSRRFALGEAGPLLLATHVGGEPLSAGHGFPVRLVAPGRRGYHWVKWVEAVEISSLPAWWQPPLPTQ
ncbi:MAG: molybdopterin-dependent oxidoreductase [Chloroflexi bacterium]|nr:molybdopterin-dependent oxidoreductase [Chloroflexota bacterium]